MTQNFPTHIQNFLKRHKKSRSLAKPPPKLKLSEWADTYRFIAQANAEPGRWRTSRAPYQRGLMDAVTDKSVRRITAMMGAQTGKTDSLINNTIGYFIAQDPKSIMVMHPTLSDLTTWMESKLNPLLMETPALQGVVAKPRGREGVNNQKMKSFPGGFLMFAYSGSSNTMRGRSAPIILCDEIDGYEMTDQGDAVQLLWQRAATFGDQRKLIETSTPTIKGISAIEKSYLASDMRRYWMPCKHCNEYQILSWSHVVWDKAEDGSHLPETARYECKECGDALSDGDKLWMLRRGEWRADKPFKGHAGFHLSELYSPFRKWQDIVQSFLDKKAAGDVQSFVNVSLAETYEEDGAQADPTSIVARAEEYRADVPTKALVLTAGIDTQDDRLEAYVYGWGEDEQCWAIDSIPLYGDPAYAEVWEQLDAVLNATYEHESGVRLGISAAAIDSGGHHTQMVYDFCATRAARRIIPIKGIGGEGKPIIGRVSHPQTGKGRRKVSLYPVGVDACKSLLFSRLLIEKHGAGYIHIPNNNAMFGEEYAAQLTAEKLVTRYRKGFPYREFIKTRPRNEALDCWNYALAALRVLNPKFNRLASSLINAASKKDRIQADTPKKRKAQQQANNWINNGGNSWL